MKNSKKLIIFYLLIILTLFSLLFTWKNCKSDNLVNVILETKIEKNNDILLKVDNNFFTFKQFNNVINQTISKDFSSLELLIKENYKKEIKSIVVFNDTKMYYFNDFSDFIQEKEKLCDGNISRQKGFPAG